VVYGGERTALRAIPREEAWRRAAGDQGVAGPSLVSPFPAQVAEIRTQAGASVAEGEVLVVLEAMKMLHLLAASGRAVVAEVCCEVGASVGSGEILIRFESQDEEEPGR